MGYQLILNRRIPHRRLHETDDRADPFLALASVYALRTWVDIIAFVEKRITPDAKDPEGINAGNDEWWEGKVASGSTGEWNRKRCSLWRNFAKMNRSLTDKSHVDAKAGFLIGIDDNRHFCFRACFTVFNFNQFNAQIQNITMRLACTHHANNG